jgi:hypothetical protein
VVADSRPHSKSAPASGFPSDRRIESPAEERSGSQPPSSEQTSRGSSGDKQQSMGGPPSGFHGQHSDQPSRPSQVQGHQQPGESFGARSSADSSNMLVQNFNAGGRIGQPGMMAAVTTTHSASPTLLAPGNSRHGDNAPSSRSKASGQLLSGASGRHVTGTSTTWVTFGTTTAAMMASFVHCTRRIL